MADNSASMANMRQAEKAIIVGRGEFCPVCAWKLYPGSTTGKCINRNCENVHPDVLKMKPLPLMLRLIREGDLGPYCPCCGSSKYKGIFRRSEWCINPQCPSCHSSLKGKEDWRTTFGIRVIPPRPEGDPPPQKPPIEEPLQREDGIKTRKLSLD